MMSSSLNKRNIIMCSQCYEEFATGYKYRLHWEEKHFYPYLKNNKFDHIKAMKDANRDKHIVRLINEISNNI